MHHSNSKHKFPFRLGTTSYIFPDEIIPNVRVLSKLIDDIELVLFESESAGNTPTGRDILELRRIGDIYGCGYTVHLPIDLKACSTDDNEHNKYIETACRTIQLTSGLMPRAWIVHLEGISSKAEESDIGSWRRRAKKTICELAYAAKSPDLLAIENLSYPALWNMDHVIRCNVRCCLDIGHIWNNEKDMWERICRKLLPSTSVIHLHGVNDGCDHLSLRKTDRNLLESFIRLLAKIRFTGIVTLEVFDQTDFYQSKEIFEEIWESLYL